MYNQPYFSAGSIVICLGIGIIVIIALWKIFEKAGRSGWEAIIPIYNMYILLKIVGKPGWWLILMLIPFLNFIFSIWTINMLSKSFGKDEGFTVGLILLGFIFYPILGFGNARYLGPYGDPRAFQAYQQGNRFDFEKKNF
ncbi:hypothetical protein A8C56_16195 [Niabella ginsenosidivorans]|uniref:Signal peptidase I n=1 Tax=Niabella ginsenosidivorans TaxID=1176587 RepID=A0A1A9I6X7_9BACT|nr:DUF5684 domain-containing protein [Niabella ginsenosidivorans]ANH82294.1 hypothetical protein A8C56_16195 [Niabella ginsenosidivorans]